MSEKDKRLLSNITRNSVRISSTPGILQYDIQEGLSSKLYQDDINNDAQNVINFIAGMYNNVNFAILSGFEDNGDGTCSGGTLIMDGQFVWIAGPIPFDSYLEPIAVNVEPRSNSINTTTNTYVSYQAQISGTATAYPQITLSNITLYKGFIPYHYINNNQISPAVFNPLAHIDGLSTNVAIPLPPVNDLNLITTTSVYRGIPSLLNKPTIAPNESIVFTYVVNSGLIHQIYLGSQPDLNLFSYRILTGTSWSPWEQSPSDDYVNTQIANATDISNDALQAAIGKFQTSNFTNNFVAQSQGTANPTVAVDSNGFVYGCNIGGTIVNISRDGTNTFSTYFTKSSTEAIRGLLGYANKIFIFTYSVSTTQTFIYAGTNGGAPVSVFGATATMGGIGTASYSGPYAVYLDSNNAVLYSYNFGSSWNYSTTIPWSSPAPNSITINSNGISYIGGSTTFGIASAQITTGTVTYVQVPGTPTEPISTNCMVSAVDGSYILFGTAAGNVYKYDGTTFTNPFTDPTSAINQILIHPLTPSISYVLDSAGLIYKSIDDGASYNIVFGSFGPGFSKLFIDPNTGYLFYSFGGGTAGGDLYRSTDGGFTFIKVLHVFTGGADPIIADSEVYKRMYVGSGNMFLYRSLSNI